MDIGTLLKSGIWYHSRSILYSYTCLYFAYTDHGIHNSTYMDRDSKSDNFYYSIDKSDTIFKVSSKRFTTEFKFCYYI